MFIESEICNYLCFSDNSYKVNKMVYWWSRSPLFCYDPWIWLSVTWDDRRLIKTQLLLCSWQLIVCEIMFYTEYLQNLDFGGAWFDCKNKNKNKNRKPTTTTNNNKKQPKTKQNLNQQFWGIAFFPFSKSGLGISCRLPVTAQPAPNGPLASLLYCGGCIRAFWEVLF